MAGPWEQFKSAPPATSKPWEQFGAAPAPATPDTDAEEARRYIAEGDARRKATAFASGKQEGNDLAMFLPNALAGSVRGAGSIGSTLLAPVDMVSDAMNGKGLSLQSNRERRGKIDEGLRSVGANPDSLGYKTGKLGAEVAGTLGVGGALAPVARSMGAAPSLVNAIATSGMRAGTTPGALNMATRMAGGAVTGAVGAGLVNPEDTAMGAGVGGLLPPALSAVAKLGKTVGRAILGKPIKDEVLSLAVRAKDLGIDVPADRIVNSKPLNAVAAGLNYVPFSGRAATEAKMQSQLNRALSRTFGQDSDNVTAALRKAQDHLGKEFDRVLSSTKVRVDSQFLNELADHEATALRELSPDNARILSNQVDDIMSKGASGVIDGQAAYNIKKSLDRISKRNSNEAHYATDMRKSLMGALNRSLEPEQAAAFANTRKQYGNMLTLEKLAQNGADGDVSIARIANMKNIGNDDLQELADISAQFLKPRESQHGAAQRAFAGLGIGAMSGPTGLATGAAVGRTANMALNSKMLRNTILRPPAPPQLPPQSLENFYRAAPILPSIYD